MEGEKENDSEGEVARAGNALTGGFSQFTFTLTITFTRAMIRGIDHINIVVADLQRSVRFYCEVLGFRKTHDVVMEGDWIEAIVGLRGVKGLVAFVEPPGGGPRIELLQYVAPAGVVLPETSRPNTHGLRHIAFRVVDIAGLTAKLRAAGVPLFSEPVRVPAGVVKFAAGDKTLVYFLDPDGVILELAEYGSAEQPG